MRSNRERWLHLLGKSDKLPGSRGRLGPCPMTPRPRDRFAGLIHRVRLGKPGAVCWEARLLGIQRGAREAGFEVCCMADKFAEVDSEGVYSGMSLEDFGVRISGGADGRGTDRGTERGVVIVPKDQKPSGSVLAVSAMLSRSVCEVSVPVS